MPKSEIRMENNVVIANGKSANRRRFLRRLVYFGLGAGFCDTALVEPRWLEINRHEVPAMRGPDRRPVKLLHLSDFHASWEVSLDFIAKAIRLGLDWKPDLIALTGDFIHWRWDDVGRYAEVLSVLSEMAPTFACLGNHDGGLWAGSSRGYADTRLVREVLSRGRVELLHNTHRQVRVAGRDLTLVGVGDWWANETDAASAFAGIPKASAPLTLLLSHNPDSKTVLRAWPWDLMLCGHTHGGQFRLPVIGTPFAPVQDRRYVQGLHRWEGRWLHITKGVGNLNGLRFNCRPEISLLTLT